MTRTQRMFARMLLGVGAAAAVVMVGCAGLLAFPQLLCSNRVRAGPISLYYDEMPPAEAEALAQRVAQRLAGSGFCEPADTLRAFLFDSPAKYGLMTRLAAVPREAQGFNLSVLGHTFVSAPRVAELGARSGGGPRYSVWEGDLAHTIAHELAHQILAQRIGRRDLPQWKREGLAEYIANIGSIRGDPAASLPARLKVARDPGAWSATVGWERHGWDRIHYESGLLVEYLMDVRGYSPEEIAADSVTLEATRAEFEEWAETGRTSGRLDRGDRERVLEASAPVVEIRVGDLTESWTLAREQNPDIYSAVVPSPGVKIPGGSVTRNQVRHSVEITASWVRRLRAWHESHPAPGAGSSWTPRNRRARVCALGPRHRGRVAAAARAWRWRTP